MIYNRPDGQLEGEPRVADAFDHEEGVVRLRLAFLQHPLERPDGPVVVPGGPVGVRLVGRRRRQRRRQTARCDDVHGLARAREDGGVVDHRDAHAGMRLETEREDGNDDEEDRQHGHDLQRPQPSRTPSQHSSG